ncbi:MAG: hypothetical protein OEU46_17000 [Alphaproteobacteria bacterium]|nr:hypothetical protein [Alphaproteobacteria bacterium]
MTQKSLAAIAIAAAVIAAPAYAGSFDDLSKGNQDIVNALFDGQKPLNGDSTTELTKDQIADLKNGTGWGNVFKQLKDEGRYPDFKNLGLLISSVKVPEKAARGVATRSEKTLKTSRIDRTQKIDRPSKVDRPQRIERPQRVERPSRPERPQRR